MKTLLTKGQKELQGKVFNVVQNLQRENGYIKGYGSQDRVMTSDHRPINNIHRDLTKCLKFNGLIQQTALHFIPTEKLHTIKRAENIEIDVS